MTKRQYEIVSHSLGMRGKEKIPKEYYRNRFIAREGHHDMSTLTELVELGYMSRQYLRESLGGGYNYWVTEKGRKAFEEQLTETV